MEYKKIKVETYIPSEYFNELLDSLNKINALIVGDYDSCIATSMVKGHWRPLKGANPFIGEAGELCAEDELKVEFKSDYNLMENIIKIIKKVHPYEEPVINVYPLIF